MSTLTPAQIAGHVHAHTEDRALAAQAVAVALAESGGRTDARHANRNSAGVVTSTDRGLWQINDRWHPEVSDRVADDPTLSTAAAARIAGGGFRNMTPWSTYKSGAYLRHLDAAKAGVATSWGKPDSVIPGPIGDVIDGATDVVTAPVDGLAAVGRLAGTLSERATWIRVVEVVGGGLLVLAGGALLQADLVTDAAGKLLGGSKGAALASVVPGGKAVKAAVATASQIKK